MTPIADFMLSFSVVSIVDGVLRSLTASGFRAQRLSLTLEEPRIHTTRGVATRPRDTGTWLILLNFESLDFLPQLPY